MESGLYLITDGACKNKTTHKAGSGFLIYKLIDQTAGLPRIIKSHSFMFDVGTYEISKITYEILNPNIPVGKYRISLQTEEDSLRIYEIPGYIRFHIYTTGKHKPGTNNRAEYLAYILGNIISNIIYPSETFTLVSDSMLLINTLKIWMANWIKKNIVSQKENPDLITEMIKLGKPKKYVHINSHLTPEKYQKLTPEYKEYSKLNDLADVLANEAIL